MADEYERVAAAMATGWIAPAGPDLEAFEAELAAVVGARHAVALSSGTAALHLALLAAGVTSGDEVAVSSFTFAASANPVVYLGATPVFIDSELTSWNMDPALLERALRDRERRGRQLKAIVLVHLYGQCADTDAVRALADAYGVALIEDAAEALGASYRGRPPGTDGLAGIYSFNGNKIITTSGGGMLVTADAGLAARVRAWSTQARDPAPHYQHSEIGYNYRLSNLLAAVGRAQLSTLEARVAARRAHFDAYVAGLGDLPGVTFMPEAPWGRHTRWLTCMTIDPSAAGCTREDVRLALEREGIEARPLWKPMHLQPVFDQAPCYNANVSARLFDMGLCLPSGTGMSAAERDEVIAIVRAAMLDGTPVTGRPRAVPGRVLLDAEQVVERVGADCA